MARSKLFALQAKAKTRIAVRKHFTLHVNAVKGVP